jgi:hypothetical protein
MIACALSFTNGLALGQSVSGLDLEWEAPESCPSSTDLRASIRQLLGATPGPYANTNVSVRATASEEGSGRWLGTLETRSGPNTGKRTLRAESCKAVAGATALIIALMIDPDAVVAHQAQASQTPPAKANSKIKEPADIPPVLVHNESHRTSPGPIESPRSHNYFFLGPETAIDWGSMPSLSAAVGGHLGMMTRPLSFEVDLFEWSQSRATISGTKPPVGGRFSYFTASLSACPHLGQGDFQYGLCVDGEYNRMKAEGFGGSVNYGNSFSWFSIGGGALARWRVGQWFSIPIRAGAVIPLAYPVFRLNGISDEVHRPSSVSLRAQLGVDLLF